MKYNNGKQTRAKEEKGKAVRRREESGLVKEYGIIGNIWEYGTGIFGTTADLEAFEQPAIFPEALAHDHIVSWSNENDTILDPFIGSGTTAKMAHILNRRYIGIDCSPRYVELAKRRVGNVEREMRGEWKPLTSTPGELDGLPMWEGME